MSWGTVRGAQAAKGSANSRAISARTGVWSRDHILPDPLEPLCALAGGARLPRQLVDGPVLGRCLRLGPVCTLDSRLPPPALDVGVCARCAKKHHQHGDDLNGHRSAYFA
jgi:hypothetical protein